MEKMLSKHGKYWIITGTPEELYDEMQAGDLVKVLENIWLELSRRVNVDDPPWRLQFVTMLRDPDSIWIAHDMNGIEGHYTFNRDRSIRKIKRPVEHEESEKPEEPADQEHGEPRLPEEKGFYEDPDGDLWYIDPDETEPKYYWFGLYRYWLDSSTDKSYGGYRRWLQLHEMSVQQAKKYGPYRRVTRIRWETN